MNPETSKGHWLEVLRVCLRLGFVAFGGPAAHTALLERELVQRRQWLARQQFLDMLSFTNLIPGPNSTELVIHLGYHRAGLAGLVAAGLGFILPAALCSGLLAMAYVHYGDLALVQAFTWGILSALVALIVVSMWRLARKGIQSWRAALWLGIALALLALGLAEPLVVLAVGLLGLLWPTPAPPAPPSSTSKPSAAWHWLVALGMGGTTGLLGIGLTFLKIGATLFGSGLVLVAYLDAEFVQTGLLTTRHLLDAVAVGQYTPGPVLSTATFVGYLLHGWKGALVATAAIFLPAFVLIAVLAPHFARLRASKLVARFLDAANVASIALLLWVSGLLGQRVLVQWQGWVIAACCGLLLLWRPKLPTWVTVLVGSVIGYALVI